jgi:hypothetical protein
MPKSQFAVLQGLTLTPTSQDFQGCQKLRDIEPDLSQPPSMQKWVQKNVFKSKGFFIKRTLFH